MNVINTIIAKRSEIMAIATTHGVTVLKLYGSVLTRTENPESDIDFLAVFDLSIPYDWNASFNLQEDLEQIFKRRISIIDSRCIPEVFRPQIDTDPVDIMTLEAGKQYSITPKSSRLYFIMLDKLFRDYDYDFEATHFAHTVYASFADKLSWWFSRLLRIEDNDLKSYEGFNFIEVLYVCDKLYYELFDQSSEDIQQFKELLPAIKEYAVERLAE